MKEKLINKKQHNLPTKLITTWPALKLAINRIDKVRGWIMRLKISTKERIKEAPLGKNLLNKTKGFWINRSSWRLNQIGKPKKNLQIIWLEQLKKKETNPEKLQKKIIKNKERQNLKEPLTLLIFWSIRTEEINSKIRTKKFITILKLDHILKDNNKIIKILQLNQTIFLTSIKVKQSKHSKADLINYQFIIHKGKKIKKKIGNKWRNKFIIWIWLRFILFNRKLLTLPWISWEKKNIL